MGKSNCRVVLREDKEWERVVMAEVVSPDIPNVYDDYWTPEGVKNLAYRYMREGFVIDIEHDGKDVTGKVFVVESFIARDGDPDFIPGSWVVAMQIDDDALWQKVLDGELNGFSFEASVLLQEAELTYTDDNFRQGVTEPDINDGHTHTFAVWVDDQNRPIAGGTSDTNGHSHVISKHTVTDKAAGHVHRYTIVTEESING